ncbi:MAG: nitroreductase family protein [Acidimicrobiales bacterium]|nr:nitroreductase family protein [Acidimicrobiales bacterium]
MTRAFTSQAVDGAAIDDICEQMLRGPSAGNTRSLELLVLSDEDVPGYWDVSLAADARETFPWPALLLAPVLVIPYVDPYAYVSRYAEPDKATTGLGAGEDAWPVPYWWVDGGAAVQTALLATAARGLGACFFGQFEHEAAIGRAFGVPEGRRALGTLAIGHADLDLDRPSMSAARPRLSTIELVHRGTW